MIVISKRCSGLGEAAARHLSEQGAIFVLGARPYERRQALEDELNKTGKALSIATDVTKIGRVKALVDSAVKIMVALMSLLTMLD